MQEHQGTQENGMSRFTTPFGFHSTAAEVIAGVDLAGKRAIITGGAAGIGIEIARALAIAGAAVTLAIRRPDAAEAVLAELRHSAGNPAVDAKHLDLSDLPKSTVTRHNPSPSLRIGNLLLSH
jgi:hypothetical protein